MGNHPGLMRTPSLSGQWAAAVFKGATGPTGIEETEEIIMVEGTEHCWRSEEEVRLVVMARMRQMRRKLRSLRKEDRKLRSEVYRRYTNTVYEEWCLKARNRSQKVYSMETEKYRRSREHLAVRAQTCKNHLACRKMNRFIRPYLQNMKDNKTRNESDTQGHKESTTPPIPSHPPFPQLEGPQLL